MAKAADLLRQRGDLDRERMVLGAEDRHDLAQQHLIVCDELRFHATFPRVAEDVEGGAAKSAQPRQQSKDVTHPTSERALAQLAACGIARGEDRRRQMIAQLEIAFELPVQLLQKGAV